MTSEERAKIEVAQAFRLVETVVVQAFRPAVLGRLEGLHHIRTIFPHVLAAAAPMFGTTPSCCSMPSVSHTFQLFWIRSSLTRLIQMP